MHTIPDAESSSSAFGRVSAYNSCLMWEDISPPAVMRRDRVLHSQVVAALDVALGRGGEKSGATLSPPLPRTVDHWLC